MNSNFFLLLVLLTVTIAGVACMRAAGFAKVNIADGAALRGFDAVAYFAADSAVKGDPKYEVVWNGAKWIFSSAENLETFRQSPESYAPQFGGYCSYAVSRGYTADGDPEAWKIVDGKLYLNYNKDVKAKWETDQAANIEKATKNWAGFDTKPPVHK